VDKETRHRWLDSGLVEDWIEQQKTSSLKRATIVKAQQSSFREAIAEVAKGDGIWYLAK